MTHVFPCIIVFLAMIIGEAFIREKQSLICLKNPDNTCVCGHYEPLNKRSFLNPYAGAAFDTKGGKLTFQSTDL